jgi:Fe-S-cluster-containing hydrogenase component 2
MGDITLEASPLRSLRSGKWVKLICGASFQDLAVIRNLVLVYSLAGVDCVDVAADGAVITAAREGILAAKEFSQNQGLLQFSPPWLMISLNDGEDPHFRKAQFDPDRCPSDCLRPCEMVCPAQAINTKGVIDERCYGCGRCLPVCPLGLITTRSQIATPSTMQPFLELGLIDAVELHTQVGHESEFKHLWKAIASWGDQLKILAISCPEQSGVLEYLHYLNDVIQPLSCPLIWQTDGRPMSGDIGKGTTHAAIKLAQKVLASDLSGYVQLAGGTNGHTVNKLKEIGLLQKSSNSLLNGINPSFSISGIAYGSYARSLLLPILEEMEKQNLKKMDQNSLGSTHLENYPDLFSSALSLATAVVSDLKYVVDNRLSSIK